MQQLNTIMRKKEGNERGFTLVEILVSLAVFAVIVTISTGSVLLIVDANRKAQSLSSIMNNLNIAMEGISRALMTGERYDCDLSSLNSYEDCVAPSPNVSNGFRFVTQEGDVVTYSLQQRANGTGYIDKHVTESPNNSHIGHYIVTASEVDVQGIQFYSVGVEEDDQIQPRVLIVIWGEAGVTTAVKSRFNLQTTVSKRSIDS